VPAPHLATRLVAEFQVAMADPAVPADEQARLAALYAEVMAGLPPPRWATNPGPQAAAYLCEADELFWGGSAGPGKSALLLGLGLTAHTESLILRLKGTHLAELKKQLRRQQVPGDRWKSIGNGGDFYTHDGRTLELRGCDDEASLEAVQGHPHDAKLWDELPQQQEATFRRVNGWLRSTDPSQRCRVVGVGNPPLKPEEEWVIRYWGPWLDPQHPAFPARPGELRWFTTIDGKDEEQADRTPVRTHYRNRDDTITPISRTFIPALLEHTPDLDRTGYRNRLAGMPEPLRSKLLYGDMQIGREDDEWQVIPTEWLVRSMRRDWKPAGDRDRKLTCAALDCAQGGADRAVLAKRYGTWVAPLAAWPGVEIREPADLLARVLPRLEDLGCPLLVDVLATPGGGAVTILREKLPRPANVWAINFGTASEHTDHTGRLGMANLRAEAYWRLREALDPALGPPETRLRLPDDPELLSELCSVRWRPVGAGKVQVEPKPDIQKRLGRSPDKADAVAMCMLADRAPSGGWLPPPRTPREAPEGRWLGASGGGGGGFMGVG
jgi:hypothetical protein